MTFLSALLMLNPPTPAQSPVDLNNAKVLELFLNGNALSIMLYVLLAIFILIITSQSVTVVSLLRTINKFSKANQEMAVSLKSYTDSVQEAIKNNICQQDDIERMVEEIKNKIDSSIVQLVREINELKTAVKVCTAQNQVVCELQTDKGGEK